MIEVIRRWRENQNFFVLKTTSYKIKIIFRPIEMPENFCVCRYSLDNANIDIIKNLLNFYLCVSLSKCPHYFCKPLAFKNISTTDTSHIGCLLPSVMLKTAFFKPMPKNHWHSFYLHIALHIHFFDNYKNSPLSCLSIFFCFPLLVMCPIPLC